MATTAAQRESIAQQIMRLGQGITAIANPRGADIDAILIKRPDYHTPADSVTVVGWVEYTGDAAAAAYSVTP